MTIPEISLLFLGVAGMGLAVMRTGMRPVWRRNFAYETGTSKTIGDREVQEDEFGLTEKDAGVMAVLADGMGKHYGGKIAGKRSGRHPERRPFSLCR